MLMEVEDNVQGELIIGIPASDTSRRSRLESEGGRVQTSELSKSKKIRTLQFAYLEFTRE